MLKGAHDNLEKAAALLLASPAAEEPRVREEISLFIDSCRYACAANFKWRFVPPLLLIILIHQRYPLRKVERIRGVVSAC